MNKRICSQWFKAILLAFCLFSFPDVIPATPPLPSGAVPFILDWGNDYEWPDTCVCSASNYNDYVVYVKNRTQIYIKKYDTATPNPADEGVLVYDVNYNKHPWGATGPPPAPTFYSGAVHGDSDPPGTGSFSPLGAPVPRNGASHKISFSVNVGDQIVVTAVSTPSNGGIYVWPPGPPWNGVNLRCPPDGIPLMAPLVAPFPWNDLMVKALPGAWGRLKMINPNLLGPVSYVDVGSGPYNFTAGFSGTMVLDFYICDTINNYHDNNGIEGSYDVTVGVTPAPTILTGWHPDLLTHVLTTNQANCGNGTVIPSSGSNGPLYNHTIDPLDTSFYNSLFPAAPGGYATLPTQTITVDTDWSNQKYWINGDLDLSVNGTTLTGTNGFFIINGNMLVNNSCTLNGGVYWVNGNVNIDNNSVCQDVIMYSHTGSITVKNNSLFTGQCGLLGGGGIIDFNSAQFSGAIYSQNKIKIKNSTVNGSVMGGNVELKTTNGIINYDGTRIPAAPTGIFTLKWIAPPLPPPPLPALEVRYPTWSPDGQFVVFQKKIQLHSSRSALYNSHYQGTNMSSSDLFVLSMIKIDTALAGAPYSTNPVTGAQLGGGNDSWDFFPNIANPAVRECPWYPSVVSGSAATGFKVAYTTISRSKACEENLHGSPPSAYVLLDNKLNQVSISSGFVAGPKSFIRNLDFSAPYNLTAAQVAFATIAYDLNCSQYLQWRDDESPDGDIERINSNNEKESVFPSRVARLKKSTATGYLVTDPYGFPFNAASYGVSQNGYVAYQNGSVAIPTRISTSLYYPQCAEGYDTSNIYFAAGRHTRDSLDKMGSPNLRTRSEMDTVANPAYPVSGGPTMTVNQGDYINIFKMEGSTVHHITDWKAYNYWPTVFEGDKVIAFMSDRKVATPDSNGTGTGRWNIWVTDIQKYVKVPIPTQVNLASGGSRIGTVPPTPGVTWSPPYNPPLIEGTLADPKTYCFNSGDSGTPFELQIDNGSNIGWGWYIVDYSASTTATLSAITYEKVYFSGSWSAKNATTDYTNLNTGLVGTAVDKILSSPLVQAEIKEPMESDQLSAVWKNRPATVSFDFPIGGEYKVGLVCYYRYNGILKKHFVPPLVFEVKAIHDDTEEAIYFKVNDPAPAGGFREDEEYVFSCSTWIDYGTPVPVVVESDLSEKNSGVLPGSVRYHWFVKRWDNALASFVTMHPPNPPSWTTLANTDTIIPDFNYVFATPLKSPDQYIVGISFEWEEIHWKPVYAGDPGTFGYDTNMPGVATDPLNIIRYELDPAYTGVVRACREEIGSGPAAAKIHNDPATPQQLIRDGTSPVKFTVADETPPEIMFLSQGFTPQLSPNYHGTTGDQIKINVKIRDNHPQEPMDTRAPLLIWEFQPQGFNSPCFQSRGAMQYTGKSSDTWNNAWTPPAWSGGPMPKFSKFEAGWCSYEATITLPFAFRSANPNDPIMRFSFHVQDDAGFTNEGVHYTFLDDDRADHNYYPTVNAGSMFDMAGPGLTSNTVMSQFHNPSRGTVSISDNDRPALAIRIEPRGAVFALGFRHNIYHVSTNDLWDPLDITDTTLTIETDSAMTVEMVHPYDPAFMSSHVPHPKVNSFPEDLRFDFYVEFYDNCIWEGTAPDSGSLYTLDDNIKTIPECGNGYFRLYDPSDTTAMSWTPARATLPTSDVVVNPSPVDFTGGMGQAVTVLNSLYEQWIFYESNDQNDDGYPDLDWTPPPAPPALPGTPPLDPSAYDFFLEVGCADKAGNKRYLKLRFPIKPIPIFINSLEEKSRIFKRK